MADQCLLINHLIYGFKHRTILANVSCSSVGILGYYVFSWFDVAYCKLLDAFSVDSVETKPHIICEGVRTSE